VQLGNAVEEKTVTTLDHLTGKVSTKTVQTTKPVLAVMSSVNNNYLIL
jgi:hypothetical protein